VTVEVLVCTPNWLAGGGLALRTLTSQAPLPDVAMAARLTTFQRVAETPLNRIFDVRPIATCKANASEDGCGVILQFARFERCQFIDAQLDDWNALCAVFVVAGSQPGPRLRAHWYTGHHG
jgi:hypothetical protein